MAQISNLQPLTELEAINSMLSAAGQSEIDQAALNTPALEDVSKAVRTLRDTTRQIQSVGWRFNTEFGVEVAPVSPAGSYTWVDSGGQSTLLNIFLKPSGILGWRSTECYQMCDTDLIEKLSKRYENPPATKVWVLYDRVRNRDGLERARYPFIYLDLVTAYDFERMPQVLRDYCTIAAMRRFVRDFTSSQTMVQLTQDDEASAFLIARREEGLKEKVNMFNTAAAQRMLGNRPIYFGGASRRAFHQ